MHDFPDFLSSFFPEDESLQDTQKPELGTYSDSFNCLFSVSFETFKNVLTLLSVKFPVLNDSNHTATADAVAEYAEQWYTVPALQTLAAAASDTFLAISENLSPARHRHNHAVLLGLLTSLHTILSVAYDSIGDADELEEASSPSASLNLNDFKAERFSVPEQEKPSSGSAFIFPISYPGSNIAPQIFQTIIDFLGGF